MPLRSRKRQYVVREPYWGENQRYRLLKGLSPISVSKPRPICGADASFSTALMCAIHSAQTTYAPSQPHPPAALIG